MQRLLSLKNSIFVLTCLMLMFLLSGCVDILFHITINKDGTGNIKYSMKAKKDILGLAQGKADSRFDFNNLFENANFNRFMDEAEKNGFKVEKIDDESSVGFNAVKEFNALDELKNYNPANTNNKPASSDSSPTYGFQETTPSDSLDMKKISDAFQVNKGLFKTKTKMDLDLSNTMDKSNPMTNMFLSSLNFKFKITMPITPLSHNATSLEDNGKTLVWDVLKVNRIQLETEFVNPEIIFGGIILIIIIILATIITVIVITIKKRSKKRSLEDTINIFNNDNNP